MFLWLAIYLIIGILFGLLVVSIVADDKDFATFGTTTFVLNLFFWPIFLIIFVSAAYHVIIKRSKHEHEE